MPHHPYPFSPSPCCHAPSPSSLITLITLIPHHPYPFFPSPCCHAPSPSSLTTLIPHHPEHTRTSSIHTTAGGITKKGCHGQGAHTMPNNPQHHPYPFSTSPCLHAQSPSSLVTLPSCPITLTHFPHHPAIMRHHPHPSSPCPHAPSPSFLITGRKGGQGQG